LLRWPPPKSEAWRSCSRAFRQSAQCPH